MIEIFTSRNESLIVSVVPPSKAATTFDVQSLSYTLPLLSWYIVIPIAEGKKTEVKRISDLPYQKVGSQSQTPD